jgi:cysteine-rich repeat protein
MQRAVFLFFSFAALGARAAPVACDDGNTVSGDGCTAAGFVEPAYSCPGAAGEPCQRVLGLDLTYASSLAFMGGGGGGPVTVQCPVNNLLTSVDGYVTFAPHVGPMRGGCGTLSLTTGTGRVTWTANGFTTYHGSSTDHVATPTQACPTNEVMTGLRGVWGAYLDGLQPRCSELYYRDDAWEIVGGTTLSYFGQVGPGGYSAWNDCPAGTIIGRDLTGRAGSWVDAIQFSCYTPVSIVCGDGAVHAIENCDDGNAYPGDGCSTSCTVEAGWSCSGTPSVCIPDFCAAIGTTQFFFSIGTGATQHCYATDSNTRTWTASSAYCTGLGGWLVDVESVEEMIVIRDNGAFWGFVFLFFFSFFFFFFFFFFHRLNETLAS